MLITPEKLKQYFKKYFDQRQLWDNNSSIENPRIVCVFE